MEKKDKNVIDLREMFRKLWQRRMLFFKVLPVVFVLSCLYIVCIPRTYTTSCRLAPEMGSSPGGGMLGSLASNFGIDFSQMETSDAITPMLYPDLMEDNRFVTGFFPVMVAKQDGSLTTTYEDYLRHHLEHPWWAYPISWVKSLLKSKDEDSGSVGATVEPSPYILSKDDDELCQLIRGSIGLDMDKKTGVITVTVSDQDPLICKTLADSVSVHLQQFITDYRTNKARIDEDYYRGLVAAAERDYEASCEEYANMSDANSGLVLNRYQLRLRNLERRMELKYTALQSLTGQLQAATAKVQERTPAFTLLKGAEMPLKPAKPKRMLFVLAMCVLAAFCTSGYVLRDYLKKGLNMK